MAQVSALAQDLRCDHESGMFCKRKFGNISLQQFPLVQLCPLCNIVYLFWKEHADKYLISSKRSIIGISRLYYPHQDASSVEYTLVESAVDEPLEFRSSIWTDMLWELISHSLTLKFLEGKLEDRIFAVELHSQQIGEAYHVHICYLILRQSPKCRVRVQFKATQDAEEIRSIEEIRDIFEWYRIDTKSKATEGAWTLSKEEATEIVGAAFRASNDLHHSEN